jgi:hypothetical protein
MAGQVAYALLCADRVADERDVRQVQALDERMEIVGQGIEIIAGARIVGAAVAATIESDAGKSALRQCDHLRLPGVGIQRPGVSEDDRSAGAPATVEEFSAVMRGEIGQCSSPCVLFWYGAGGMRFAGPYLCDRQSALSITWR